MIRIYLSGTPQPKYLKQDMPCGCVVRLEVEYPFSRTQPMFVYPSISYCLLHNAGVKLREIFEEVNSSNGTKTD